MDGATTPNVAPGSPSLSQKTSITAPLPNSPSPAVVAATGPATGPSFMFLPAAANAGPLQGHGGDPAAYNAPSSAASAAAAALNTPTQTPTPTTAAVSASAAAMANNPAGSLFASPIALSREPTWSTEATSAAGTPGSGSGVDPDPNVHLSGTEPRYFPGVATRSQRRNSLRQNSYHEVDDGSTGSVSRLRNSGGFGAPEQDDDDDDDV